MGALVTFSTDCDRVDWRALKLALIEDDFDNGRTPAQLERSFRASARVVFARHGDAVVGTGRALSDGICNAYIVDMWTRSTLRRQGIGRRILELLTAPLEGQHVYLFTDDQREFYAACGFVPRGTGLERVVGTWLQNASRS
jgi:GNAT superfamily N-acetyltransferase